MADRVHVQQANSGHPGTPMGLAPVAYTLWQQLLRFDPQDPTWPNRDRFVLSNGHVGTAGAKIGMHTFGSSAPIKDLLKKFGFTPEKILDGAKQQLARVGETAR